MPRTAERRPGGEAATHTTTATVRRIVTPALPIAWHEQTEYEVDVAYAAGFAAGVEYARAVIDAGIAEAVAGEMPTAKEVVNRLVRQWEWADRRAAVPDRPDYPGRAAA